MATRSNTPIPQLIKDKENRFIMKKMIRKLISLMLVVMTLLPLCATAAQAASWPSLSSSAYCEFKADSKINVYRNSSCTTRGTSSPAKSYNAYISKNDVCRILQITSSYVKLQYPTSSGYRTAYARRSDVFNVSAPSAALTSKGKVTTYASPGGSSYGYVAKGDKVYVCGTDGSYTALIYQAKSGSRAYKLGYVKTSDYNATIAGTSTNKNTTPSSNTSSANTSSSWDKKVGTTVANIKNGSSYGYYYNKSGNISAAGGYIGQCTWYALGRFYEVNGIALKTAPHAKKWLTANSGDSRVTVVYGADKIASKSIAVRTSGTYGHVIFIEHVTFKNGAPAYVYFTECNSDGNGKYNAGSDCVVKRLTYSQFVSQKNPAGYIIKK